MAPKVSLATDTARERTKTRACTDRWPHSPLALYSPIPDPGRRADRVQGRSVMVKRWIRPLVHGDRLTAGQEALAVCPRVRSWSQIGHEVGPELRVSLLSRSAYPLYFGTPPPAGRSGQ